MTHSPRTSAAAFTLLLAGGAMLISSGAMARGFGGGDITFEMLDMDGSGEITADEIATYRANAIEAMDTDGDGFLSMEELQAARAATDADRATRRFEMLLKRADENGDDLLSIEEFASMGSKRGGSDGELPRGLDADGSGGIDAEEFAAAQEHMAERGEKRGKGKHDKGSKDGEGSE